MVLAKPAGMNPRALAELLVAELSKAAATWLQRRDRWPGRASSTCGCRTAVMAGRAAD
jgi:hypothetical protein